MNTFHDLFRQPTRKIGVTFPPDRRRELFPGFVERSPRLHLWSPGNPIVDAGPRLLIGVATWSGYDLNTLDLIEELPASPVHVDVFDLDECRSPEAVGKYIPGMALETSTPVVGLWIDGVLKESASGTDGRQLIARVCGISNHELEGRMSTIYARL